MNSFFKFQQFDVRHDRSSMKVGTDGVLLGSWVSVADKTKRILDVGTGTGLIALMLAQRASEAVIDAVEIQQGAFEDACENFNRSKWSNRLHAHHCPVQQFKTTERYDLIVSNPPYFINSFKPPDHSRALTRHSGSLTFEELAEVFAALLRPDGLTAVILPPVEGEQFIYLMGKKGFYCTKYDTFKARSHKAPERLLLEFSRQDLPTQKGEIIHYGEGNSWSDEYRALTGDFYLKK